MLQNLIGQTIGKYQIVAPLGQGGMAHVYKAYQPNLDRYVAIKVLHSHLLDQAHFVSRFEQEASLIARLRHPHIVQVYDSDVSDALYYIVMEYIEGPTLKAELDGRRKERELEREGLFTPVEVVGIMNGLCQAVAYAHSRGMIHRDIKPGNVIFTADGQPLLADFGLSHLIGEGSIHSKDGAIVGTPAYMSPEQCRGRNLDPRSDIYSLAVLLYELLTGETPFPIDNPVGAILRHLTDPFPPLNGRTPPILNEVLRKASHKEPEERYQSAEQFAAALRSVYNLPPEDATRPIHLITTIHAPNLIQPDTSTRRTPSDTSVLLNPYRGLYAFREEDSTYFFGRELFTQRLITTIQTEAMVAVVGPSGSGKSSVIFAGLIPHLREQGDWLIIRSRPGSGPFESLANALVPHLEPDLSEVDRLTEGRKLAAAFRSGDLALEPVIRRILARHPDKKRVLLISDQFEELFTLCHDPDEQRDYPNLLFDAVQRGRDNSHPFALALTLRADFVGQALAYRPFADALQNSDIKLGPMTREELGRAIENPARLQSVIFEPGLVDRILDDVGREPGNLPLLEFALTLLWEKRNGRRLTHATYEAIGRVEGALARYADEIYTHLSAGNRARARRVFTQMVRPGEGTEDTRRVATQNEFTDEDWAMVNFLADARLLVTGRLADGDRSVEVVHEALIRGWGQLRTWMNEDRAFRTWQERLRAVMRQWETSQRDEGALLRGALLAEAEEWVSTRPQHLSTPEQEFITASITFRRRRQMEQEAQRQRELEAARQLADEQHRRAETEHRRAEEQTWATHRLRGLAMVLAAVFVLAVAAAIFATGQRQQALSAQATAEAEADFRATAQANASANEQLAATRASEAMVAMIDAEEQRDRADASAETALSAQAEAELERDRADNQAEIALARQLAAQSTTLLNSQPDLALLLSLEAVNRLDSPETQASLLTALQNNPRLTTFLHAANGLQEVRFSPDGTLLASAGGNGSLELWDVATGAHLSTLVGHDPTQLVNAIAFGPNGNWLASASDDLSVRLWDISDPTRPRPLGDPLLSHEGFVQTLALSPDGNALISAGGNGDFDLRIWNPVTAELELTVNTGHTNTIWYLAYSPDGRILATASLDGTVRLFDTTSWRLVGQPLAGHTGWVMRVTFSPDGTMLATGGGQDNLVMLWDVATQQQIGTLTGHAAAINGLTFSHDGQQLYSGSADSTVLTWDVATQTIAGPAWVGHSGGVTHLNLSPDGTLLATADAIGDIILWATGNSLWPIRSTLTGHPNNVQSLAFSPDGERLASGGDSDQVLLWAWSDGQPISQALQHTIPLTLPVSALALSQDGQWAITGSENGSLRIWDMNNGAVASPSLLGPVGGVTALTLSPDGAQVAFGGPFGTAWLADVAQQQVVTVLNGHTAPVRDLAFSPDGLLLASVGDDGALVIRELVAGQGASQGEPLFATQPAEGLTRVAFSADGQMVVTGDMQGQIVVWSVATRTIISQWSVDDASPITGLAFADASTLVAGTEAGSVFLWNLLDPTKPLGHVTHPTAVSDWAFAVTGTELMVLGTDGRVTRFDRLTGERLAHGTVAEPSRLVGLSGDGQVALLVGEGNEVQGWDIAAAHPLSLTLQHSGNYTANVSAVAFAPDGQTLVSTSFNGSLNLWDGVTGELLRPPLLAHTGNIVDIAYSPDGRWLASAGCHNFSVEGICQNGEILLWDTTTWTVVHRLVGETGIMLDIEFTPDSQRLLSNGCAVAVDPLSHCLQGAVWQWDVATGELVEPMFVGPARVVSAVAVSPDGRMVAGGDWNSQIYLWDNTTGAQIGPALSLHTGPVQSLTFSADGRMLVSTSTDTTVVLWDVATGQAIGRLVGQGALVTSAEFTPEGQLLTGGLDGRVLMWEIGVEQWRGRACHIANRTFTSGEWSRFFGEEVYHDTCG